MAIIKNKSPVLFFYNNSKKWLMNISKKESLHTHIGVLKHADAIGKEPEKPPVISENISDSEFEDEVWKQMRTVYDLSLIHI